MTPWIVVAFFVLTLVFALWAGRVWRKHEKEALYERPSGIDDPGYLEKLGDGFHGGSGPSL